MAPCCLAPENLNYHKYTTEGARDCKLVQKKPVNFKIGKYTHKLKEVATSLKKFWKTPTDQSQYFPV